MARVLVVLRGSRGSQTLAREVVERVSGSRWTWLWLLWVWEVNWRGLVVEWRVRTRGEEGCG